MTADDLTWDVKQQLLAQVRSQLGSDQYAQLVGSLGEDGVVNLVLNQMRNGTAAPRLDPSPAPAESESWVAGCLYLSAFIGIGAGAAALAGLSRPDFGGFIVFFYFAGMNYWGVLFDSKDVAAPAALAGAAVFFLVGVGAGAAGFAAGEWTGGTLVVLYFGGIPLLAWAGRWLRSNMP